MWRASVVGWVVTALVMVPVVATACSVFCLESNGPQALAAVAASAAHADHHAEAAVRPAWPGSSVVAGDTHDCRNHDRPMHRPSTLRRSTKPGRAIATAAEAPLPPQAAVAVLIGRHIPSSHGPPGRFGQVTPLVLRI